MLKRIRATYIENNKPQSDHLVLIAPIDSDGAIADGEIYGFVVDNGSRYPFVGNPDGKELVLDYGAFGRDEDTEEKEIARLNLVGKRLRVGDLFTRVNKFQGESRENSYTYRVESIV